MTTDAAEAGVRSDEDGPRYYGRVIIEWPAPLRPGRSLAGWACSIFDAETGKPIVTAEKIAIPAMAADAQHLITCELTVMTDGEGAPALFDEEYPGRPGSTKVYVDDEGKVRTGTFPFLVAEMRVRQ
jgi:hypothetical protein